MKMFNPFNKLDMQKKPLRLKRADSLWYLHLIKLNYRSFYSWLNMSNHWLKQYNK